jgi:hypothetical protein
LSLCDEPPQFALGFDTANEYIHSLGKIGLNFNLKPG